MNRKLLIGLLFTGLLFVLLFGMLEVAIRLVGHYDQDGQFSLLVPFRPYTLPVQIVSSKIATFSNSSTSYIIPDEQLGWTIRPSAEGREGLYHSNAQGLRAEQEFTFEKTGKKRIALFGDSFMHSDDVPFNGSFAFYLDSALDSDSGEDIEVLNFGVGGYGVDQAYLRWKTEGQKYSPDVVVLGLFTDDCFRSMTTIRALQQRGTGIPFSKPQFVKNEFDGNYILVNSPAVSYTDFPEYIASYGENPWSETDFFYKSNRYEDHWYFRSKTVSFLVSLWDARQDKKERQTALGPTGEVGSVCMDLIEQFASEAGQQSDFLVVYFPEKEYLEAFGKKEYRSQDALVSVIGSAVAPLVDPVQELLAYGQENSIDDLFVGHYSPQANEIIAQKTASVILERNESIV